MREKTRKRIAAVAGVGGFVLLTLNPARAAAGITSAAELCINSVVPALFPFAVISCLLAGCADSFCGKRAKRAAARLFGLPAEGLPVLFVSLLGGYPTGAMCAASLFSQGKVTGCEARRLSTVCFNPGPGFVLGVVGEFMLGSRKAGTVLLFSVSAAAVICAAATGRFTEKEEKEERRITQSAEPVYSLVSRAVSGGVSGMLNICGWVLIFGAVFPFVPRFAEKRIFGAVMSLLEITTGLGECAALIPLPWVAALLSFGGVCTHCQVLSVSSEYSVKPGNLFLYRLLCSGVSFLLCLLLCRIFPACTAVSAAALAAKAVKTSRGIPAAASLMFLCAIFILDLDNRQKMCYY